MPPTELERHEGFYLRLMAGYGYTNAKADFSIADTGGPQFQLAMGYSVLENLALFVQLKESQFRAAGVGASYHFTPVNVFAGVVASAGNLSLRRRAGTGQRNSAAGPVVSVFFGKEWWVSENWGLGLAFDGDWGKVTWKDEAPFDQPHDISAFTLGAACVATFN